MYQTWIVCSNLLKFALICSTSSQTKLAPCTWLTSAHHHSVVEIYFQGGTVQTVAYFTHLFCLVYRLLSAVPYQNCSVLTYTMVSVYINMVVSSLNSDSYICSGWTVRSSQYSWLFRIAMCHFAHNWWRGAISVVIRAADIPNTRPDLRSSNRRTAIIGKLVLGQRRNTVSNMSKAYIFTQSCSLAEKQGCKAIIALNLKITMVM